MENMKMYKYGPVERFQALVEERKEHQKKLEALRAGLEMKGFTGQPTINSKSKRMFKTPAEITEWANQQRIEKLEKLKKLVDKK